MWRYLGIQVMDVSEDHRVALVLGAVVLVRGLWAGLCNFEAGVTPADCFLSLSLSSTITGSPERTLQLGDTWILQWHLKCNQTFTRVGTCIGWNPDDSVVIPADALEDCRASR